MSEEQKVRLRARATAALERAKQLRAELGIDDPVQALVDLFEQLPPISDVDDYAESDLAAAGAQIAALTAEVERLNGPRPGVFTVADIQVSRDAAYAAKAEVALLRALLDEVADVLWTEASGEPQRMFPIHNRILAALAQPGASAPAATEGE